MPIPATPAPTCPICQTPGPVTYTDCPDPTGALAGTWRFRRCPHCATLWQDPCPTREALPALYAGHYYTHAAPSATLAPPPTSNARRVWPLKCAVLARTLGYTALSPHTTPLARAAAHLPGLARWASHFVRYLPARPAGRLLDVGAGNGAFLARMAALGWNVAGIEPDPEAAHFALAAGLAVQVSALEAATLAPHSYDAITLMHVLEHLPDPAAALAQLAAALAPGGYLVSYSPNPQALGTRWFGTAWRGLEPPRHLILPSAAGYRHLLAPHALHIRTWSSVRSASWMTRQSLATRRTGRLDGPAGPLAPLAIAAVAALGALLPLTGDELICVAQRPR